MIRISERDKKIFEFLAKYEVMSSKQIKSLVFNQIPETNFFRRLRELEKAKMVKRMGPMTDHVYAWLLAEKGKSIMGFEDMDIYKNRLTLEHDVTLTQLRIVLDLVGLGKNIIGEGQLRRRAREQRSKHYDQSKKIIVPDALIPVMLNSRAEVFALELELHFKNRQRYIELFKKYIQMEGIYAIWYVVPSRSMANRMLEEWDFFNLKHRNNYSKNKLFCVTELDQFLNDPMNAVVRDRTGETKISQWWNFKIAESGIKLTENNQKNNDHSADQSLIENLSQKTEAA